MDKAALTTLVIVAMTNAASATTVTLFEGDPEKWKNAVGHNLTTIDFTGGVNGAFINDDYAHEGLTFSPNAHYWNTNAFVNDNWGMEAVGGAWLTFDTPQHWIAFDFPGGIWLDLYYDNEKIYTSPELGGGGLGFFAGLVSSLPFHTVHIYRPEPHVNIIAVDDLHFGALVPGPGGLALLALAGFAGRSRRRGRFTGSTAAAT